jgi:hypothetical protein
MAKEYVYHGSSPTDEECAQVGEYNYTQKGYQECKAYVGQLYRLLAEKGYTRDKLPESYRIHVKSEAHDFGSYYEVVSSFDPKVEEAWDIALLLDNDVPCKWDAKALEELAY